MQLSGRAKSNRDRLLHHVNFSTQAIAAAACILTRPIASVKRPLSRFWHTSTAVLAADGWLAGRPGARSAVAR